MSVVCQIRNFFLPLLYNIYKIIELENYADSLYKQRDESAEEYQG